VANSPICIGLIGCGTVGRGVVKLLHEMRDAYTQRLGAPIEIVKVLVRDPAANRDVPLDRSRFTSNPDELFNDERISIIVEVAGGVDRIGDHVRRALESGRHVVTANKSLLAKHGVELFSLARRKGVCIAFEASCGGGIPILAALKFGLNANRIQSVYGILNGTCNFILTEMTETDALYEDALADAQAAGFAEADPTLDVSGADAAQKLAIIASLAFGVSVTDKDVTHEGIDGLDSDDVYYGAELGYVMKLLAIGEKHAGGLVLRVAPCFVYADEALAQVRGSFNALSVFGHAVGHTMFYGHGAGQMPTASSVVSDILNVAGGWYPQAFERMRIWPDQHQPTALIGPEGVRTRYYLRLEALDEPGVMGRIAGALGAAGISLASILQTESPEGEAGEHVPVVITTHHATEKAMASAVKALAKLDSVAAEPVCIRILDLPEG
jgi:homoserine dehydrogenase